MDPIAWLDLHNGAVQAVATVVLAGFAFVEIRRYGADQKSRERAADAKVSAEAFALRRQLRSWLASENRKEFFTWAQEVTPHMDRAEVRLNNMAGEAANGSANVQEMLREATARFYRGTNTLNETLNDLATRPRKEVLEDLKWEWPPADKDIQACVDLLTKVIDYRQENANQRLAALWGTEKPLKQLGDAARAEVTEDDA
jgi:hypothetical protein